MVNRRDFLRSCALLPTLPLYSVGAGCAGPGGRRPAFDPAGRRLVLVRLAGGNDGLNALVPFRDDVYHRSRPSIALDPKSLLGADGGDLGFHPALRDFKQLMDEGEAAVLQGVGYPRASRSHLRATEIWSTGSTVRPAPQEGWLGRWADRRREAEGVAGYGLGSEPAAALRSAAHRTEWVASPHALVKLARTAGTEASGDSGSQLGIVRALDSELRGFAEDFERASMGSGAGHGYPETEFGASLRWVGDLIETEAPAQTFHVTLGSFERGFSFDTHLHQLAAHDALYAEFGRGVAAFASHLRDAGHWSDTLVMTYSDFGRQIAENRTNGTEHGDAGLMFLAGGRVDPGIHGLAPDLRATPGGGLAPVLDFRRVYHAVLSDWLAVDATRILGTSFESYAITV